MSLVESCDRLLHHGLRDGTGGQHYFDFMILAEISHLCRPREDNIGARPGEFFHAGARFILNLAEDLVNLLQIDRACPPHLRTGKDATDIHRNHTERAVERSIRWNYNSVDS